MGGFSNRVPARGRGVGLTAGFTRLSRLTAGFTRLSRLTAGFTRLGRLTAGFTRLSRLTAGFTRLSRPGRLQLGRPAAGNQPFPVDRAFPRARTRAGLIPLCIHEERLLFAGRNPAGNRPAGSRRPRPAFLAFTSRFPSVSHAAFADGAG